MALVGLSSSGIPCLRHYLINFLVLLPVLHVASAGRRTIHRDLRLRGAWIFESLPKGDVISLLVLNTVNPADGCLTRSPIGNHTGGASHKSRLEDRIEKIARADFYMYEQIVRLL